MLLLRVAANGVQPICRLEQRYEKLPRNLGNLNQKKEQNPSAPFRAHADDGTAWLATRAVKRRNGAALRPGGPPSPPKDRSTVGGAQRLDCSFAQRSEMDESWALVLKCGHTWGSCGDLVSLSCAHCVTTAVLGAGFVIRTRVCVAWLS